MLSGVWALGGSTAPPRLAQAGLARERRRVGVLERDRGVVDQAVAPSQNGRQSLRVIQTPLLMFSAENH
jgi:hypothetical protein